MLFISVVINKHGLVFLPNFTFHMLCINLSLVIARAVKVVIPNTYLWNHFIDFDYDTSESQSVFSAGNKRNTIHINTRSDSLDEKGELFFVIALLPENRGSCTTTITIVDKSKLLYMYIHTYRHTYVS